MRRLEHEQKKDPNLKIPSPWINRIIYYDYKGYKLKMQLPEKYPFQPPKIICGKTDHIGYFLNKKRFFSSVIKHYSGFPCICCRSITCLWSPAMTVKHMADEYKRLEAEYKKGYEDGYKQACKEIEAIQTAAFNRLFSGRDTGLLDGMPEQEKTNETTQM